MRSEAHDEKEPRPISRGKRSNPKQTTAPRNSPQDLRASTSPAQREAIALGSDEHPSWSYIGPECGSPTPEK
jgi:hypothetical protein